MKNGDSRPLRCQFCKNKPLRKGIKIDSGDRITGLEYICSLCTTKYIQAPRQKLSYCEECKRCERNRQKIRANRKHERKNLRNILAQKYYEEGVALGPNRPQTLYGLFDVYRAEGNVASTTAIGEKILSNWPTDTSIATGLQSFLKGTSSVPATTTL